MQLSHGLSLLIVTLAAAILPGVCRVLRFPSPVAEILFGTLLGKSLLNLNIGEHWLPFLAELGFLVLMFHAGMEIDFALLRKQGKSRLAFQVVFFILTLWIALLAAAFLSKGMFIALVLSTSSLGLVMPVLRESGQAATPFGQTVLVAATLADFLTLLGITFFVLWHDSGLSLKLLTPLPMFLGFGLLLWGTRLWAWWNPDKAEKLLLAPDTQEQGVRLSLALLFLFVGLSELAGVEPVLGAFMGGCIISFVIREKDALESKISAIGFGFLVPLFFIHVGMGFDAKAALAPERLAFSLQLLAAAVAVKMLPCLIFPLWRMKLADGMRAGALLSSRLSLIVAAAAIGLQQGFITAQTRDSIVLLALFTCFLGPVAFRLMTRKRKN